MVVRIRFVTRFKHISSEGYDYSQPWIFILHIISLIVILIYSIKVTQPAVSVICSVRTMLNKGILSGRDSSEPFSVVSDISGYIDEFKQNILNFIEDTFLNIFFKDVNRTYDITVKYKNGTIEHTTEINFFEHFFNHVEYFDIATEFLTIDNEGDYTGCTKWNLDAKIMYSKGSYCIHSYPGIKISACDYRPYKISPSLYYKSFNLILILLILSIVSSLISIQSLLHRFKKHNYLFNNNPEYHDLENKEQFHKTIGFWAFYYVINNVFSTIASFYMLIDANQLTQFPSNKSLKFFGIQCLLMIVMFLRWMVIFPKVYRVVQITKLSINALLSIILGIFPLLVSLMFISIFLFGFVTMFASSFVKLFESDLSLTFGDMISTVYESYTDGTTYYNILAFIFVTIMVAIGMWLFFTVFTASITYLHRSYLSKIVI